MKKSRRLLSHQEGATAIEYAFIVLLIFLAIVFAVTTLGTSVKGKFVDIHDKTSQALGPPG